MFGKSRPDPGTRESAVLQCRVSLRKLQVKYRAMLERETRLARELREKNMSSPSNDMKIKINYYMLREIDRTMTRLSEIRDTAQLNEAMNEFAGVLASVNRLSEKADKAGGKAVSKNIRKMNQRAEKEECRLTRILGGIEKQAGPMESAQEEMISEKMMETELEEEPAALTDRDLDEINWYVEEMIRTL